MIINYIILRNIAQYYKIYKIYKMHNILIYFITSFIYVMIFYNHHIYHEKLIAYHTINTINDY